MKANFSLSIPNPCSEDWSSFTPTSTGGFCGSCQKNVIDFTKSSDDEIIAFISKKPEHTCGRFRSDQLKTYIILPEVNIRPGFIMLKAGLMSLLLLLVNKPGSAQTIYEKAKTEIVQKPQEEVNPSMKPTEILIKGIVTSSNDSLALHGVNIVQQGTSNGAFTNRRGQFEFRIDPARGDVIVFSYIGLETQTFQITTDTKYITIIMNPDPSFDGEVVVVAGGLTIQKRDPNSIYTHPESGLKKFWKKVKSWF